MVSGAIGTALSGLQAQTRKIENTATNIANLTTSDFQAQETNFQAIPEDQGRGVVASTNTRLDPSGLNNVSLEQEAVNLITAETAYKANLLVIESEEERLGDLLDTLG